MTTDMVMVAVRQAFERLGLGPVRARYAWGWLPVCGCIAVGSAAPPAQAGDRPAPVLGVQGPQPPTGTSPAKLVAKWEQELGVRVGVLAMDHEDVRVLYHHRPKEPKIPASNQKLLTAAATLVALGADYRFTTRFSVQQDVLVVRAGGDPNWRSGTEHDPERVLDRLAERLRAAGIASLEGVVVDPGVFTGPSRPPGWPEDQLEYYYCAPTAGLAMQEGCFLADVHAPVGAARTRLELLAPQTGRSIAGEIHPVPPGSKKKVAYGIRDPGDGRLRARGKIVASAKAARVVAAVADPQLWAELTLVHGLRQRGIEVGDAQVALSSVVGTAGEGGRELFTYSSPLAPALRRCLTDSSNFTAEMLTRCIGAAEGDGSLAGGVRAMERQLVQHVGELGAGVELADGSGLSRNNRITPMLLVATLHQSCKDPKIAEALFATLPRAGRDGTMKARFKGMPVAERVWAKTGWIRGASSLSGIVRRRDGGLRLFSILVDYRGVKGLRNATLKRWQEELVDALDRLPRLGPLGGSR